MLDFLTKTVRILSLKNNVQKSGHIVFRYANIKIVSVVKIYNRILKTVAECKYSGAVLTDDLSFTKDVERVKVSFFKQYSSLYNKFSCTDQEILIYLFQLHPMSFYGVETWFMKL